MGETYLALCQGSNVHIRLDSALLSYHEQLWVSYQATYLTENSVVSQHT